MTPQEFISKYQSSAIISCVGKNLFPSVLMAQAALETSWGASSLSSQYNNFFGIKATSSWGTQSVNLSTGEVFNGVSTTIVDAFEVYNSPYYSFLDRNRILGAVTSYVNAGVFTAVTPEEQCNAIRSGGWATDPMYASKLISIINGYNLKELDQKKRICESVCSL